MQRKVNKHKERDAPNVPSRAIGARTLGRHRRIQPRKAKLRSSSCSYESRFPQSKQRPFFLVYKGRNKGTKQSLQVASVLAERSLLARDAQGLESMEEALSEYEFKSKNSFLLSHILWLAWPRL